MKDMEYSYEYDDSDDIYCYPKTDILRNKLEIHDSATLRSAEREFTSSRYFSLKTKGVTGDFSMKHICSVHHYLFQDIYEWAGEIRTEDISKGTIFCMVQFIESQYADLYRWLKKEKYLAGITDLEQLSKSLAYYLGELNMIHPFREGNGRTQRTVIEQLCENNGRFEVDFSAATKDEMITASIESSVCKYERMEELMFKCMKKK